MIIYIGDSKNVIKRIRNNHCSGNVEGSALRRHIAKLKKYKLKSTKRISGSIKVRIDSPNPRNEETDITNYIRFGKWKFILCDSYNESHDFQWFAIEQLKPRLNKYFKPWNQKNIQRYQFLLNKLKDSHSFKYEDLLNMQSGPGIYILYHQSMP